MQLKKGETLEFDSSGSSKLEQLFGSKTRVKLLYLFYTYPDRSFFIRELTRKLRFQINSIRRELANLTKFGIIQVVEEGSRLVSDSRGIKERKYFKLNPSFILNNDLKNLFFKSQLMVEKDHVQKILNLGSLDYFILTGKFTGVDTLIDILLVGQVDREKLSKVISDFERYLKKEINYSVLEKGDFIYRRDISDKFICDILNQKKVVIKDTISDIDSKTASEGK